MKEVLRHFGGIENYIYVFAAMADVIKKIVKENKLYRVMEKNVLNDTILIFESAVDNLKSFSGGIPEDPVVSSATYADFMKVLRRIHPVRKRFGLHVILPRYLGFIKKIQSTEKDIELEEEDRKITGKLMNFLEALVKLGMEERYEKFCTCCDDE